MFALFVFCFNSEESEKNDKKSQKGKKKAQKMQVRTHPAVCLSVNDTVMQSSKISLVCSDL